MGSPLSPFTDNFFMEDFEHKVVELPTYKPKCWYGYVDDTFDIWLHGVNKGMEFFELLTDI